MIRYGFDTGGGDISTDEENILIGFSTQEKHGQIMYIRNDAQPREYISIEINNNGMLKQLHYYVSQLAIVWCKQVCYSCCNQQKALERDILFDILFKSLKSIREKCMLYATVIVF